MNSKNRCAWAGTLPIYLAYHDNEWGRPVHDDNKFFEMLVLESMQAGLSWITILNKREAFRIAFDNFDPYKVALFDETKFNELMNNKDIVRNALKIKSAINNAKVFIKLVEEYGSFDKLIWSYVDYTPVVGHWESEDLVPASTKLSDRISKDFKKFGFKFIGTTIIYSFLQATGIVNDHVKTCFLYGNTSL